MCLGLLKPVSGHEQMSNFVKLSPETLSKIWENFTFFNVDAYLLISVVLYVTIEKQLSLGRHASFRKT